MIMTETERITIIIMVSILLLTGIIVYGCYEYKKIIIENFQNTIKDLTEEQKCLHICGFEFRGYFESYKMCIEKCDRISERENVNCLK